MAYILALGKHSNMFCNAFGAARTEFGISSNTCDTVNYEPGGTLCAVLVSWVHKVATSGRATGCGRWKCLTLAGKEGKNITVLSVYNVSNPANGHKTALQQQSIIQYANEELRPFVVDPYT
jgi:hypothetical protein